MLAYFLSPIGRIGRRRFWLATVLSASLLAVSLFALAYLVIGSLGDRVDPKTLDIDGRQRDAFALTIPLAGIAACGAVYLFITACGRRYNDRGRSSWWVFISFVPILGFVAMMVELGFVRGTRGRNRYGPPPGSRLAGVDEIFGAEDVVIVPERGRVSNTTAVLAAWIASLAYGVGALVFLFQQS